MNIDWSKAPEGATHWKPSGTVFGEGWMKKAGNEWSYWLEGSEVWAGVWADCFVSAEREAKFEARPQEVWDGHGLPPVGTVCEIKHRDIGWVRCEIVAHKSFSCGGLTHAIAWIDENTLDQSQGVRFRPIRTPEQIAAEEREKAIEEMCFAEETLTVKQAKALYDAGYRRQEEGK
ncbi:TPA: hypothetical protein NI644_001926 [Pseudomonas aeruginosa]|uniref:hypothetical protein n=1 Tax=Pseudomonas aeruginosa TaxID=287 RepID=UPI000D03F003|nr:hypothetical protein [Pseudomonas aeruginosa]MBG5440149.1 hypothetical protein [Pseudomonas aeruginosa]MBI7359255.1 hypothetical protein [Pseudomonas aeruginosa]MBV6202420.1 hypothetical protein [Pseudomonas aeruginosa]HCE6019377.1 hypothetical protein [Pseudomonas aeruginosa]HCF9264880.1 hypothetical protein [Pseudomonas aeruginosa]